MTLDSDLNELFSDDKETIIFEPIRFKAKLGIGKRAFRYLKARQHLTTFSESLGVGVTASAIASTPFVAATFFANSSFLAAIGLGAAATTPVGWILAVGAISGAAYAGTSRFFERSKDSHLIVIPKYINTPLDILALALIEMMLPISLKVAKGVDGISDEALGVLHDYYHHQWGYNLRFINRLITDDSEGLHKGSFAEMVSSLQKYCRSNPDCEPGSIFDDFRMHIHELVEANGFKDEKEIRQLAYLSELMAQGKDNVNPVSALGKSSMRAVKKVAKKSLTQGVKGLSPYTAKTKEIIDKISLKAGSKKNKNS